MGGGVKKNLYINSVIMQVSISLIEEFRMCEEVRVSNCWYGRVFNGQSSWLVDCFDSIVWLQVLREFIWSRTLIWIVFETGQSRMSIYSPAEIEREI